MAKIRQLVYGPTGSGKSWYCASAVRLVREAGGQFIVFDTGGEDGWRVIAEEFDIPIASTSDVAKGVDGMLGKIVPTTNTTSLIPFAERLVKAAQVGKPLVQLVVIDGLSEQETVRIQGITQDLGVYRKKDVRDVDGRQVWGEWLDEIHETIRLLRPSASLAHLICTAMRDNRIDPDNGGEIVWPALRGQFGKLFGHYFDLVSPIQVVRVTTKGGDRATERRMSLKQTGDAMITFRWEHRSPPPYLVNPTFADVLKVIEGKE